MLRLDASVPAIAERAISSYDYVHAAISTYPAFLCMNFDIRAVGFPFNSVYTDFPSSPRIWRGGGGEKKGENRREKRKQGSGAKTNCYFPFVYFSKHENICPRTERGIFFNVNFISPSFLHWLKTVATACNDRLGNFYVVHVFLRCHPIVPPIKSVPHKFFPVCENYFRSMSFLSDILLCIHLLRYISYFPLGKFKEFVESCC